MSWLWGKKDDPLKDLDPGLKEFLRKEAPKQYTPGSSKADEAQSYRAQVGIADPSQDQRNRDAPEAVSPEDRPLPKESLFQDGRYKHIWKNYRPQGEAEEAGKSDQEKLMDIVSGYKERQAQIGRTAMESCSNEQFAVHECFRSGSWSARMTMCRAENRQLERCIVMQSRFLRALGYLSIYERPVEETDRIQMHADTLYHQMLEQEKLIKEAKEKGEKPPEFGPLMKESREEGTTMSKVTEGGLVQSVSWNTLPPEAKERLTKQRLSGLEGPRLELAKAELDQEIAVNAVMVQLLDDRYMTERRERLQRLEKGQERLSDKIKRWFDLRKYDEDGRPVH